MIEVHVCSKLRMLQVQVWFQVYFKNSSSISRIVRVWFQVYFKHVSSMVPSILQVQVCFRYASSKLRAQVCFRYASSKLRAQVCFRYILNMLQV